MTINKLVPLTAKTKAKIIASLQQLPLPFSADVARYLTQTDQNPDDSPDGWQLGFTLPYPCDNIQAQWQSQIQACLKPLQANIAINFTWQIPLYQTKQPRKAGSKIKNILLVASAKGGVGKSTIALNLAVALAQQGAVVGLLDGDVYGPSLPTMLGTHQPPETTKTHVEPIVQHGIKLMSIGFLVTPEQAMVWRGPIVINTFQQLLHGTNWGELDYLIIDLPPGTGDIQLHLSQNVPISGAVVVTTPHKLAVADVVRGITMFDKVGIPPLGLIENMSYYLCPKCEHKDYLFGQVDAYAGTLSAPVLAQLPLTKALASQADGGLPVALDTTINPIIQQQFTGMAFAVLNQLAQRPTVSQKLASSKSLM